MTQTTDRPSWSLTQAAAETGISLSTLKRKKQGGAFPNAHKDHEGRWLIPVTDLIAAGLRPGRPRPPDQLSTAQTPTEPVSELRQELIDLLQQRTPDAELAEYRRRAEVAEAKLEGAQARLEERQRLVEALQSALRQLEAAPVDMPIPESLPSPGTTPPAEAGSNASLSPPATATAPSPAVVPTPPPMKRRRWWTRS